MNDNILKEMEKTAENISGKILEQSERWNLGQKIVACLVCLFAGAALIAGRSHLAVTAGVTVALFGIAFLSFRRRTLESETLVLRDSNGRPRIVMNAQSGIVFFDEKMDARIHANVIEGQPVFHMKGDKDVIVATIPEKTGPNVTIARLEASQLGSGTRVEPGSIRLGPVTNGYALWLDAKDDTAMLTLRRPGEKASVSLHVNNACSAASVGEKGNVTLMAADDGQVGVVLTNEKGETTVLSPEAQHAA